MNTIVDQKYAYLLDEAGWYEHDGYIIRNIKQPNGKRTSQRLNVLIAELEWGVPDGYIVHHRNENKLDNRVENLELMTLADHISHHHKGKEKPYVAERNKSSWMRNLLKGNKYGEALAGDANGRSQITDAQWLGGLERLFSGDIKDQASLAREFGIQRTQVGYVIKGKSRKHLQPQILALMHRYGWK